MAVIHSLALVLPHLFHVAAVNSLSRLSSVAARDTPASQRIMNFSEPGLCYAAPMSRTFRRHWDQIQENVDHGKRLALDKKVIFAGLVRNAEKFVVNNYDMLRRLGLHFKDYQFHIFESDSTDDTPYAVSIPSPWDARYSFQTRVLNMSDERGLERPRMERMATLRNMVRDWIEDFVSTRHGWDLVVLYDFDNAFAPRAIPPHAFFNALGRQETRNGDWDMLCANGLRHQCGSTECQAGHYDCSAFRDSQFDSLNSACHNGLAENMFAQYDLVPVHSCFGGLAMYNTQKFLDCHYNTSAHDSEHVGFHSCMRQRGSDGRMFMDPLLTVIADPITPLVCTADVAAF